jgi:hypothetical protein
LEHVQIRIVYHQRFTTRAGIFDYIETFLQPRQTPTPDLPASRGKIASTADAAGRQR